MATSRPAKRIVQLLGVLLVLFTAFLTIAFFSNESTAREHAIIGMSLGLIIFWVVLGGLLTLKFRNTLQKRIRSIHLQWQITFVLFCTVLALLEEAVTVTMTNLAPVFGVRVGEAYITASANYFDVVFFHSVIVFVPMFVVWSWLLARWNFSPAAVFLLFGLQGILAESLSFGFSPLGIAFWVYVYGLMVYLPAYSLPAERGTRSTHWYHYPIAILLPFFASIPVALLIIRIHSPLLDF